MFVNKILVGEQAGLYLPLAMARLQAMELNGDEDSFGCEKFVIGGYIITVTLTPVSSTVMIIQYAGPYLEFFASGKPPSDGIVLGVPAYQQAVIGVEVGLSDTTTKVDPQVLKGHRSVFTSLLSLIKQQGQVDMVNEPNACVGIGLSKQPKSGAYPRLLYESWAPMHSHTGVFFRNYSRWNNVDGGSEARDVTYDVPWADSKGKGDQRNAYIYGDADWPRSSGVMLAKDAEWGTREFAIWVDASSNVFVFPTGQITKQNGETQNVDPKYIKSFAVNFPAWAFHMPQRFKDWWADNGTVGSVEFPEIDWKVHPDGTKMCAVVYKRTPVVYDAAYFSGLPSASGNPLTDYNNLFSDAFEPSNLPDRYLLAPGLIESSIAIGLTGPNPEDFTVSGITTVVRDPETTQFGTVLCGYVWHDVMDPFADPAAKVVAASRGDMCVLDIEYYYDATVRSFGVERPPQQFVKNLTTGLDINYLGSNKIIDFDMKTLSFAVQYNTVTIKPTSCPLRTGYPPATSGTHTTLANPETINFAIANPGVGIYIFGKFAEMLLPPGIQNPPTYAALTPAAARAQLAAETFFPMNDATPWVGHQNIRDYMSWNFGYGNPSYTALTVAESAFIDGPLNNFWDLMYLQAPRFGFYTYSSWINHIMRKHPKSILFAHPNGSWAFFDSSIIYNGNGITTPLAHYDTLAPFDASLLSVAVFDRVHLVSGKASVDTTFIDLYNKALTNSRGPNVITEPLLTISASDFQPTFAKGSYNYTMPVNSPAREDDGKVITGLELSVQYGGGQIMYIQDGAYQGGANLQDYNREGIPGHPTTWNEAKLDVSPALINGGGLFLQHLNADFWTGPGRTGVSINPLMDHARVVFSTPTLIVS